MASVVLWDAELMRKAACRKWIGVRLAILSVVEKVQTFLAPFIACGRVGGLGTLPGF
jgi:hypothetical protein